MSALAHNHARAHHSMPPLAPSGQTLPELGPVSPDRSKRLRDLLEDGWRRHISRRTATEGIADPPGAPVRRNWNITVHTTDGGAPVGCEGSVLHDRPGSVALHLPPRWTDLYDTGWAIIASSVLLDVHTTDHHARPHIALAGRWSLRADGTRGGWRAILAPWWVKITYATDGRPIPRPLDRTTDHDVLAGLPTPWPLAW